MLENMARSAQAGSNSREGEVHGAFPHRVHFYQGDSILDALTSFVGEGLDAGERVLVVATEQRVADLLDALESRGVDREDAARRGLTCMDARSLLETFLRGVVPDSERFFDSVGKLVANDTGRPLRVYGEMVDLLCADGHFAAALLLEDLWNELQRRHPFTLFCAYDLARFEGQPEHLKETCEAHSHHDGLLYQRAAVSESGVFSGPEAAGFAALASEVVQRKSVEWALRRALSDAQRSEDNARSAARQLELVTDALPVLVSYVDREHRYCFVNQNYERWFGAERSTLVGRHAREVLGAAAYEQLLPYFEVALAGSNANFRSRVPYADGGPRDIEASYIPHVGEDGRVHGFVALVSDISDRRRLEEAREVVARRAERLLRIRGAIADDVTAEQVVEAVVDQVAHALQASSAALWLLDGDRITRLVRAVGYTDDALKSFDRTPLDALRGFPALDCIRLGAPVWLSSQRELIARYPHLASSITVGRSYRISCLPIVVDGSTLGAVGFTFEQASPVDDEERNFLQLIARYTGQALERLRLLELERQMRTSAETAAARLEILSAASRAFSEHAADDVPHLLDVVARQLSEGYADGCAVLLVSDDGETLELGGIRHQNPELFEVLRTALGDTPIRIGEGLSGRVVSTGEPVLIGRVDQALLERLTAAAHHGWMRDLAAGSVIVVPLPVRGKIIGTLAVVRGIDSPAFDAADLRLVKELGERAAVAIETSRLYRDNRVGRARAELLYDMAEAVIAADNLQTVLSASLDTIARALDASRAAILTFDGDDVMRFRASRGLSDGYRRAVEGHSPWSRDAKTPESIQVPDVEKDPSLAGFGSLFREEGIRSLAFIPLVAGERLIGKFMVYYAAPRVLSAVELALARGIANHVASAVVRFSTLDELQKTVRFNEMFTGILGHDLRNPLGAILTAAQVAQKRDVEQRLQKPLARILTSGARMAKMIDQLLDFTRVRVGSGMPLRPTPLQISGLLRQVVDELEAGYPTARVEIEVVGDDDRGSWDGDRLSQVFSNLVANAIQHGEPERGVHVRLGLTSSDAVQIDVRNHGAIAEELIGSIFEPMTGSEQKRDRSQGLGLGLYISSEIVKAHRGRIDVSSSPAHGTSFSVHLPRSALESGP